MTPVEAAHVAGLAYLEVKRHRPPSLEEFTQFAQETFPGVDGLALARECVRIHDALAWAATCRAGPVDTSTRMGRLQALAARWHPCPI